jgi:peptide/nickel transport system permease protein
MVMAERVQTSRRSWIPISTTRAIGLILISIVTLAAVFAPLISPYSPLETSMDILLQSSPNHLLGTDELGRDLLSRVIYGGRVSLSVGIGAAAMAALIGLPMGLLAGYFGGYTDAAISYVINLFIAMPTLVLALMITAVIGASFVNIILVLGFVNWPRLARLVRGETLVIRERLFVEAAQVAGANGWWILRRHIEPNTRRLVWPQLSLTVADAIFTASSLSFLGLGIPPPQPDWGGMVRAGIDFLPISPLFAIGPSLAVAITISGFYLLGKSEQ